MAQITVQLDDKLKEDADALLHDLGLNITAACGIFIQQVVMHGGMPFEITPAPFDDVEMAGRPARTAEAGDDDALEALMRFGDGRRLGGLSIKEMAAEGRK